MRRSTGILLIFVLILLFSCSFSANAAGYYIHDPMDNPKAAADIIVDPDAVYGYAPDPNSTRLGAFAEYDWSDKDVVEEMRRQREEYHESVQELYQIKADMEAEGKSVEEIARAVSARRNEIRMETYKNDPEGLKKLKESNLATFGNENGGTPEYFYAKYGSWETVIEKAFSTNAGADACLGLYDKYYYTYFIDDTPESSSETVPSDTEKTVPATPDDHAPATADSSMKSPQTGDRSIILICLILVMTFVVVISVIGLIKENEKNR